MRKNGVQGPYVDIRDPGPGFYSESPEPETRSIVHSEDVCFFFSGGGDTIPDQGILTSMISIRIFDPKVI